MFASRLVVLARASLVACSLVVSIVPGEVLGQHGVISDLSAEGSGELCAHSVPSDVCTRCNPELEPRFQAEGDWCRPHRIPESQCFRCHPNLTFAPMPEVAEGADVADLSEAQALEGLEANTVADKVTVFAFDAPWCMSCRNLEIYLRERASTDARLAVRRIDVAGWEGPVYDRYVSSIRGLPYVVVHGPDGSEAGAFDLATIEQIAALIDALGENAP